MIAGEDRVHCALWVTSSDPLEDTLHGCWAGGVGSIPDCALQIEVEAKLLTLPTDEVFADRRGVRPRLGHDGGVWLDAFDELREVFSPRDRLWLIWT